MGTAVTTIQSIDPLTGLPLQPQTFQVNNVEAFFDDPLMAGGVSEGNPFNLLITSAPQGGGLPAPGGVSFWSAGSFNTSTGPFLAQYWDITLNEEQTQFQGILREDFVEGAIAFNTLDLPTVIAPGIPPISFPKVMAEGTQISGSISQNTLQATIVGNTIDQFTSFVVEISDNLLV